MKKIITIAFLLLMLPVFIFGQNKAGKNADLKILYEMKMGNLTENKEVAAYYYELLFNNTRSIYADVEARTYYDFITSNKGNSQPIMPPKAKGSVYKENEKLVVFLPINGDMYSFDEPLLQWTILKGREKKVAGYNCLLAKTTTDTGVVFYTWFTSEIPIPEGPFRFKGLSGVVLEIYNEKNTIWISAMQIQKSSEEIVPLKYTKVYAVEKKDFLNKRKEFNANPTTKQLDFLIKIVGPDGSELKDPPRKSINPNYFLD